jgi:diamine N-acetyltransferase
MIEIREIDRENVFDVCELTSNKDGVGTLFEAFICCNAISISEAAYFPECHPRALYRDGELIGFFLYKRWEHQLGEVEICRYMLDHKFIGQGLGRASFEAMLSYFRKSGVKQITLMIDEHNRVAKKMYLTFGFTFTGKIDKDEHYYSLSI